MKTPLGEDCIGFSDDSRMYELVVAQAQGSWQNAVAQNLVRNGYIIGYLADGPLKGKAKKYSSKYRRSLSNLMDRIETALLDTPYSLCSGPVGPKGGYGWYIGCV